jgi:hypothetical protein
MRRSLETFQRVIGLRIEKISPAHAPDLPRTPSATGALYVEYWSALRERLLQNQSAVKSRKPFPQHWTNFTIGRSGFHLAATASVWKKEIGVELILGGLLAKHYYFLLLEDRAAIEGELGMNVEWRVLPAKKESHVVLRRSNSDPSRREEWPEQHAWIQDKLEAFHKVFGPRIKDLNAEQYTPESAPP